MFALSNNFFDVKFLKSIAYSSPAKFVLFELHVIGLMGLNYYFLHFFFSSLSTSKIVFQTSAVESKNFIFV